MLVKYFIMEKYIKYKRFAETHDEKTLQEFYDKLIAEGWEIIYYHEIQRAAGMFSNTPEEQAIHIVVVAGKRQDNSLSIPKTQVL